MRKYFWNRPAAALVVGAVTLGLVLSGCSTSPSTQSNTSSGVHSVGTLSSAKPTIVLIHGAFEDASVWSAVAQELQKDHYRVVVPAVPLEGPESDAAYVAALTGSISGPTVLVGHSYGGLVVSELAKKLPDVVGLVYVAAFIPVAGDSLQSLNTMFKGSLLGPDTVEAVDTPKGPSVDLKPSSYPEIVGKGLPAAALAVGAASQRPLLASAMTEPVLATAPSSIPAFAIVARNDKAIAPEAERFMARRAHAKTTELNSPHAIPLAHAGQVTSVIEKASSK